jgi:hypothetical protein
MAVDIAAKSKTACLDYGWLYKSAYQRGGNPTERGSKQRHSAHSDTSDLLVGDVNYVRDKVNEAARSFDRALRQLQTAEAALGDAFARIDEHRPAEPDRHESVIERPADKGDLARAKQAKERREARAQSRVTPWAEEEVRG